MVADDIKILKLFDEKAKKLLKSSMISKLENSKISLNIIIEGGIVNNPTYLLPDQEFIESFLLTLRFFIQNNEASSIRNLLDVYISSNNQNMISKFETIRNQLLRYMDCKCPLQEKSYNYTRKEVFDIFIYGEYAHSTHKYEFERIRDNDFIFPIYSYIFVETLFQYLNAISEISILNDEFVFIMTGNDNS